MQETWLNRRNAGSYDSSQTFNIRGWMRAGFSHGEKGHCNRWGHRAKGAEMKWGKSKELKFGVTASGHKAKGRRDQVDVLGKKRGVTGQRQWSMVKKRSHMTKDEVTGHSGQMSQSRVTKQKMGS